MDVIGLSKNGIENVVANLGTSLTDRQILTLNQFFDDIIICFDGDESGYKAALRAAENSIKELKPEKQISFLFLPNKEDPDSYVNKNGKNNFLEFTKQNKLSIHQFIFSHYKRQTENNPSSMAIFEKKLRSIANTIKDDYIKKYVLEYFLQKITELTPHSNQNKKSFNYKKTIKSLDSTKKIFKDSQSLTGVELKEYSLLYLLINNLSLIQENLHLADNIKFFTEVNRQIFKEVFEKLKSGEKLSVNEMNIDKQLLDKIDKFAPIKNLLKNKSKNDYEVIELFEDISRDLMNYDLEHRIKELESKFSKDLSEVTFNELKELKKKQNIN
jgi:DNA primase